MGGVILLAAFSLWVKYNIFYALTLVLLLSAMKLRPWQTFILKKLGNQSMNMWMIHSWFCYYLFKDFIYSFSYPLLIFAVLTIISYVCGAVLDRLALPIERLLLPKAEIREKPIL